MRPPIRRPYTEVMRATRPVFYCPLQGDKLTEAIRGITITNTNGVSRHHGPFQDSDSRRFSASTVDDDKLTVATDASYHPGNTLSVGGWFNRLGPGDASAGNGANIIHLGTGDLTIWFPFTTNTDRLVLRKAGTGDIFASSGTWGTPFTRGWQFVIFTKTGTSTVLYINGVADAGGGTTSDQTLVAAATDIQFGMQQPASGTAIDYDGLLAHWAIWNRVLTIGEVKALYLAGVG